MDDELKPWPPFPPFIGKELAEDAVGSRVGVSAGFEAGGISASEEVDTKGVLVVFRVEEDCPLFQDVLVAALQQVSDGILMGIKKEDAMPVLGILGPCCMDQRGRRSNPNPVWFQAMRT